MGSILIIIGIGIMVPSFVGGSTTMGVVGLILTVLGAILFWRTSATKAYLDEQKRRR